MERILCIYIINTIYIRDWNTYGEWSVWFPYCNYLEVSLYKHTCMHGKNLINPLICGCLASLFILCLYNIYIYTTHTPPTPSSAHIKKIWGNTQMFSILVTLVTPSVTFAL